ncbi:MAG: phosphoribosylamine--glycine ligase [Pseudobdellovibrio sp.]
MNILVVGSGGREHAVIKAFSQSPLVKKIYCAPGNAGMAELATRLSLNIQNENEVIEACKQNGIDFVFIGPEEPLVNGLSDGLRKNNISVFGPSKSAAQLEGSKIFAKAFMNNAGIPTAASVVVESTAQVAANANRFTAPYILKADGLAAGKGVFICRDLDELKIAADNIFEKKILGAAGARALLEQNLPGTELSFLVLTNGHSFECLPLAQDHKRLLNQNKGPNTGGMGTIAPMQIEAHLYEKIIEKVVKASVAGLEKENFQFYGVLFIGLMIVNNEPYVLEYNVRFGDPETQVILPLLKNDIAQLFFDLSRGRLNPVQFNNKHAFCIVNAAEGYPDNVVKNTRIDLPQNSETAYILHAGTALNSDGELVSSGGRVLNIVAVEKSLNAARTAAYELNSKVKMQGRQYRTDLGEYF